MSSFQKYKNLRRSLENTGSKVAQVKEAIDISGLKALAGHLSNAFAAAGNSGGMPMPSLGPRPNLMNEYMNIHDAMTSGPTYDADTMRDARALHQDERRIQQQAFDNQATLLRLQQDADKLRQGTAQNSFQNAISASKLDLDRDTHALMGDRLHFDRMNRVEDKDLAERRYSLDVNSRDLAKDRFSFDQRNRVMDEAMAGRRLDLDDDKFILAQKKDQRENAMHGLQMMKLENDLRPGTPIMDNIKSTIGSGIGDFIMSPLKGIGGGISDGLATAISAPATTFGYRFDKMLNGGFGGLMNRIKAPDAAASRFIETAASNMADKATDLLADITSKSVSALSDVMVDSPARKAILKTLRAEDPIIGKMTEQELMDAYHTIVKFAPTLAKDKNAVKSALRQAAQYDGMDYMTIKGLAEAEASVSGEKRR